MKYTRSTYGEKGYFPLRRVLYDSDRNSYLADSNSSNKGVTSIYFYIFLGSYGALSRLFLQRYCVNITTWENSSSVLLFTGSYRSSPPAPPRIYEVQEVSK